MNERPTFEMSSLGSCNLKRDNDKLCWMHFGVYFPMHMLEHGLSVRDFRAETDL